MKPQEKREGGDLFIVDNGDTDWKVLRYLHDWADLAHTLDIATGYFEIGSLLALDGQWQKLAKLRILMGDEVSKRTRKALLEGTQRVTGTLDASIEKEKELNDFLTGVPPIVEAIRRKQIECRVYTKEKFHAKAYITHAKQAVVGSSALVGSSNFTLPGLTHNVELNVQIRREVEELQKWYERHWGEAEDITEDVLRVIERHVREYSPFDVYAKALQEFFRGHELTVDEWERTKSRIYPILDQYQREGYGALMKIARRYCGGFLCDGVGLGKTYIGLMVIERLVELERKRVALFVPKAARESVWEASLRRYLPHIGGDFSNLVIFNHTDLLRSGDYQRRIDRLKEMADAIVIDEAHHFRNPGLMERSRYWRLFDIAEGKELYLLTATPVNNRLIDLQHMIELFSRRQSDYFRDAPLGIHSLPGHFRKVENELERLVLQDETGNESMETNEVEAEQVLSNDGLFRALVVQRSRAYVKESQKQHKGKEAIFPKREDPKVANYSIKSTYGNLLERIEKAFNKEKPLFSLAIYYPLAYYKGPDTSIDPLKEGRQKEVVSLIRVQFLKRFESSARAFEASCNTLLLKLLTWATKHSQTDHEKKRLDRWMTRYGDLIGYVRESQRELFGEEEEPDEDVITDEMLEDVEELSREEYKLEEILDECFDDLNQLADFLNELRQFKAVHDDKLQALKKLLKTDPVLKKHKVLIFSEYMATARYLKQELAKAGVDGVDEVDSAVKRDRGDIIRQFAPYYNSSSSAELAADGLPETRILISTDVLSEGLNLQDATRIINYDIHWNPVRLMQRIGRVDRRLNPEIEKAIVRDHADQKEIRGTAAFWNFLPPDELDNLLRLYCKVSHKTLRISKTFGIEGKKLLKPEDDYEALKEFNHTYEGTTTPTEAMHLEYQKLLLDNPGLAERLSALPGRVFSGKQHTCPGTQAVFFCYALPAPSAEQREEATAEAAAWSEEAERLTNDFFKRFDKALDGIQSDLREFQKLNSAEAYTQAQLLLERLIFLYFLQNRAWLNQDRRYLPRHLDEHSTKLEGFTYYKEFLDKLFWTLSTAPGSSPGRLPGIPFLNGGLFDDDEFAQPSDQRKTNPPLKVRNKTFQFVFKELLEAFNFTVTEDTPLNQEVAVDPEMLGKVFESIVLRAEEKDPDAASPHLRTLDKRKATGSYYTPRIVVHFICQEVLFQYLRNHLPFPGERDDWGRRLRTLLLLDATDGFDQEEKELLKKTVTPEQAQKLFEVVKPLKCCDPAVGSGAFPVGLLHELVNLRRVLEAAANGYVDPIRKEGTKWLHTTKADIVQNSLFGVDIQQQAIEICRLRLWLSLVVDYDLGLDPFEADKTQFNRAIDGISQLPNLEMNFHRGDSLHDHISGVPIVIMPEKASHYADDFGAIAERGEKLHRARKAEQKRKLRVEILGKRLSLSQRIIGEELKAIATDESALDKLFHDETESSAAKRKRIAQEKERLQEALAKIDKDRKDLEKLSQHEFDSQFYVKLRKLEGADFDSPFNFAWYVDFPGIFSGHNGPTRGGFDIIVGNPPFVTARNPEKRELWRGRWPRVTASTYQLVCPFFEVGFGTLRSDGQLGYIVSNAFAKRNFGKPLVENFLTTIEIQKIVDCSGLMFPGHGTPTCLLFGRNASPNHQAPIRVIGILPGGGDLKTLPEESLLWHKIARVHDEPGFLDSQMVVADRPREEMSRWPWSFDTSVKPTLERIEAHATPLSKLTRSYGSMFDTHKDDVFMVQGDQARRYRIEVNALAPVAIGDCIRDWAVKSSGFVLKPYDPNWRLLDDSERSGLFKYLRGFRHELGGRATFGGGTYDERGEPWHRYHQMSVEKITAQLTVVSPEIATHGHFVPQRRALLFTQTAPLFVLNKGDEEATLLVSVVANSPVALLWLKQVCFSKRESDEPESDTYYEFAGGKVQQLPVPKHVIAALNGKRNGLADRLGYLSKPCWERGQKQPGLALKKLFAKSGEAYHEWNSDLPGYEAPDPQLGTAFDSTATLRKTYKQTQAIRNRLRAEMIALQEEMDWLVYAAYGLLPEDHPAVQVEAQPDPLDREQRPFRLWAQVEGDFARAVKLIPTDWPAPRKSLWEARLTTIRDNEHIRRIEQPAYKRRWDEQWKVGNQWRCGPIAYAAEFVDAFEWWLREKAEWWLENKKNGGPVEFDEWAQVLWKDARVHAAWPVAAEEYARLEYEKACQKAEESGDPTPTPTPPSADFASFKETFWTIVDEESVPEGLPFGIPYDELEKKLKKSVPVKVRKARGKLNVPRERFHLRGKSQYLWAGLQFK